MVDNGLTATGASQLYFIGLGGNDAGGPKGTAQTSTNCTAGTPGTIGATQASQTTRNFARNKVGSAKGSSNGDESMARTIIDVGAQ